MFSVNFVWLVATYLYTGQIVPMPFVRSKAYTCQLTLINILQCHCIFRTIQLFIFCNGNWQLHPGDTEELRVITDTAVCKSDAALKDQL